MSDGTSGASVTTVRRAVRYLSLGTCLLLACRRPGEAVAPSPTPAVVTAKPAVDPCAPAPVPGDTPAALARVTALRGCGDAVGALAIFAELLRRDPRPRWGFEVAALAIAEDLQARAREVLQDDPGAPARVGLALLHVAAFEALGEAADRDLARTDFQAALAVAPDDPYALSVALRHYLALAEREPGRLALAVQLCRERISVDGPPADGGDPRGAGLLAATCARVALESQEPGEARRRFALALTLDPTDPGARLAWAAAELAAGNDRKAAELYAGAAQAPAAGDRYIAALGLGVALGRLHDHAGAEQAYRAAARARSLTPDTTPDRLPPELQFNLGTLLAGAADPKRRAEARALLGAYAARPDADELRRLRCRQLLLELRE